MKGGAVVLGVGLAMLFLGGARRARAGTRPPATPKPQPAPVPNIPVPTSPQGTEPPRPRATPKTVHLETFRRYELVADVLPVKSLPDFVQRGVPKFSLKDLKLVSYKSVDRNGHEVTRLTFEANCLVSQDFELERENALAGIGSFWLVSARDVGAF